MTAILPTPSAEQLDTKSRELVAAGVRLIAGHMVNAAGIHLAKLAPVERLATFAWSGLGASPTWNVFAIDGGIAFTPDLGVVGDFRLRLDVDAIRVLDAGLAWGPVEGFDQDGNPLPISPRGTLRRVAAALGDAGLTTLVGHELEFILTTSDSAALPRSGWTPYGLGPVLDAEGFVAEFEAACAAAGLPVEQLHAEYAVGQLEVSLPPRPPLEACDNSTLAKVIAGRVARRHGLQVSFAPVSFAGGGGNGAHLHFSMTSEGRSLFSGGATHGITSAGASAIAGVVRELPGLHGVLAGSILSPFRLLPGYWSGAWACWGTENREAAVRFLEATRGNPHGANVEVKIGDASQNVYYATAAVLAAALRGITEQLDLPPEITGNPAEMTSAQRAAAGVFALPSSQAEALDALEASTTMPDLLGVEAVAAILATRRFEIEHHGTETVEELTEHFRLAWSV